jgi:Thioredoxin-like domain
LSTMPSTKRVTAPTCSRPPRWLSALCVAVILLVVGVLLYQWFMQKREHFSSTPAMVKFEIVYVHMKGCGYCEQFSKAGWADFVRDKEPDMRAIGVKIQDYDRDDDAWQALNITVQGFPTVLMIDASTKKEVARYSGERSADALASWASAVAANN